MDMNLEEIRSHWEHTLEELLAVVCMESELYVLLRKVTIEQGMIIYYVHRYFPIGDNTKDRWEVSIDYEGYDLLAAIEYLQKRMKKDCDAWLNS